MPKSSFIKEAQSRGFIFQVTDLEGLDDLMSKKSITAYIGFDPTANSLHVGSLVQLMLLRLLQKHGHRVIALLGGGTAQIGDPSFREEARQLMTDTTIANNLTGIEQNIKQIVKIDAPVHQQGILVNNA